MTTIIRQAIRSFVWEANNGTLYRAGYITADAALFPMHSDAGEECMAFAFSECAADRPAGKQLLPIRRYRDSFTLAHQPRFDREALLFYLNGKMIDNQEIPAIRLEYDGSLKE